MRILSLVISNALKSDYFRIEIWAIETDLFNSFRLKSDYFRIEIQYGSYVYNDDEGLKSDYFRIEMIKQYSSNAYLQSAKIRLF